MKRTRSEVVVLFIFFFIFVLTSGLARAGARTIELLAKEGTFYINPISGEAKNVAVPFFGYRRFVEFPVNATTTRVKDHLPILFLNDDNDPQESFWLVKLKPWPENKVLVLDLQSPSAWEGTMPSNEPDESCNVPYYAIEEKPGLWRITPKRELDPGDYGLFRWASNNTTKSTLYGFEVEGKSFQKPVKKADLPADNTQGNYKRVKGIILNNGDVIEGQIIYMDDEVVKIRTKDGNISAYSIAMEVKQIIK